MSRVSLFWNLSANGDQSLDSGRGSFLEDKPSLETPVAPLL
jgi:hypothetical protein